MKLSWLKAISVGSSLVKDIMEVVSDGRITASEVLKIVGNILGELGVVVIWDMNKE